MRIQNIVLTAWVLILSTQLVAADPVTIVEISGSKSSGDLKTWTEDKLVLALTSDREFHRKGIQAIHFDRTGLSSRQNEPTVWLSNGDQISARAVSIEEDVLTVSWPVLGDTSLLKIPLERVSAIVFQWPFDSNERLRIIADLETVPRGNDLVVLMNEDRSSGEIKELNAAHLEMKVGANSLKLDRSRVRYIRFNPELTTSARPVERRAIVTMTEGSRLTVTSAEFVTESLKLKSTALGAVTIPVASVSNCHFFGDRLIPVSDYEPVNVEFTPYLSSKWQYVRNANVRRGPLKLRDTSFVTGLGMHSRMVVTYALKGTEREFRATVGIDDLANGAGSVVFGIELDGQRAWTSPDLTGKSPPMTIPPIDLRGTKQIALVVEYGQFADVSDYADWCDAVFLLDAN